MFVNGISPIGFFCFWSCFEVLGGFVHSKRELVVEILSFLLTGAPREKKTEEEPRRSGVFAGESVKKNPRG